MIVWSALREVEHQRRIVLDSRRRRSGAAARSRRSTALLARPLVDRVEQAPSLRSASAHWLRSEPENWALPVVDAGEPADEVHADVRERVEIDRAPIGSAGELERRQAANPVDVVDSVVALVDAARSRPSTTGCPCLGTRAASGRAHRPPAVT